MVNVVLCSIEDCVNPRQARGWCSAHYGRWHRYGDAVAVPTNSLTKEWRVKRAKVAQAARQAKYSKEELSKLLAPSREAATRKLNERLVQSMKPSRPLTSDELGRWLVNARHEYFLGLAERSVQVRRARRDFDRSIHQHEWGYEPGSLMWRWVGHVRIDAKAERCSCGARRTVIESEGYESYSQWLEPVRA